MKHISIAFVVATLLAGTTACGKKAGGSAATADCGPAVDNAIKISSADMKSVLDDKGIAKAKDAMLNRCKEDKWTKQVGTCIASAKTGAELEQCFSMNTPDQQAKLKKEIEAILSAAMPAGSDAGSAGSAVVIQVGSGSAGSAGSGSAGSAKPPSK